MFTLELYCFFCFQSSHASEKRFYVYVRASVAKKYPAITVIVFFQLLSSTMQCGVFALIVVRDPTKWKLNLDIGLIGVSFRYVRQVYHFIHGERNQVQLFSSVSFYVQTCGNHFHRFQGCNLSWRLFQSWKYFSWWTSQQYRDNQITEVRGED
ncbi:uncharacterized protein LOC106767433 isoform X2 [Vigna radiata var. radiata]|uniref:Uncharacterized protein LOC106767433 isoform X2 n=1 Tax=Vigna radiata var. radiata TaxID=3916 RepID=A0A1S3UP14_VIGRR|nr:uncharacterized protein LOC106767433 isoform X2 [Vigna radiata var. radiata]